MWIDPEICVACGKCMPYCPCGAIRPSGDRKGPFVIDAGSCYQCGVCLRMQICPTGALTPPPPAEDTRIQAYFSDPNTTHKPTGIPGRGTEESKTNDVTGRIKKGELGLCIEFGRPSLGCTFADIEPVMQRLRALNVRIEENNPLRSLIDKETGTFPDELLDIRVLSSILEIVFAEKELESVLAAINTAAREVDTVFSVGLITRFETGGSLPVVERLQKRGYTPRANGKINLGMGRPLEKA